MLSPAGGITILRGPGVGPRGEVSGEAAFQEEGQEAVFPAGAVILGAAAPVEDGTPYVLEKAPQKIFYR